MEVLRGSLFDQSSVCGRGVVGGSDRCAVALSAGRIWDVWERIFRALGLHHQTVQRCVERAVAEGPMAALDDRSRPGRELDDCAERQGMAGGAGVPEDQGPRLSLRTLDDAISGRPRSRARTGRGTTHASPIRRRARCARSMARTR
jgi:Winged helix-turn helix